MSFTLGTPEYNREAIFKALLTSQLEGIDKFSELSTRLKQDIRFRYCCDFGISGQTKKHPKSKQSSTNSNWHAKLDSFKNKITWFGYKLNLAVDAKSELPRF
ncbi:transposase [Natranaerofaba carboxydovora]|uniref:transposase n=1 Tax=Natranaerofaba carboxydovora TaxID=2742683 RepID=UPI003B8475EB